MSLLYAFHRICQCRISRRLTSGLFGESDFQESMANPAVREYTLGKDSCRRAAMAITSLDILNLSHSLKDICEVNCNTPECLSQTLKILMQYNLIQANLQFSKQFGPPCMPTFCQPAQAATAPVVAPSACSAPAATAPAVPAPPLSAPAVTAPAPPSACSASAASAPTAPSSACSAPAVTVPTVPVPPLSAPAVTALAPPSARSAPAVTAPAVAAPNSCPVGCSPAPAPAPATLGPAASPKASDTAAPALSAPVQDVNPLTQRPSVRLDIGDPFLADYEK